MRLEIEGLGILYLRGGFVTHCSPLPVTPLPLFTWPASGDLQNSREAVDAFDSF